VEPDNALLAYSGLGVFRRNVRQNVGGGLPSLSVPRAKFICDHVVTVLGWNFMVAWPGPHGLDFPMREILFNYGVGLRQSFSTQLVLFTRTPVDPFREAYGDWFWCMIHVCCVQASTEY